MIRYKDEPLLDLNKKGYLKIPQETILQSPAKLLKRIFKELIIIRCEFVYAEECFLYHAYSELFDELENDSQIPSYLLEIETDKDAETSISFRKLA